MRVIVVLSMMTVKALIGMRFCDWYDVSTSLASPRLIVMCSFLCF